MPAYCDLTAEAEKKEQEKKNRDLINEKITEYIFENLGKPKNLHKLSVKRLWDSYYRINTWLVDRSQLVESYILSDSFFLETSDGGEIISCDPEIKRKYNNG
jgi:hypothetical protein